MFSGGMNLLTQSRQYFYTQSIISHVLTIGAPELVHEAGIWNVLIYRAESVRLSPLVAHAALYLINSKVTVPFIVCRYRLFSQLVTIIVNRGKSVEMFAPDSMAIRV